jgi:hypothetical protein
MNQQQTKIIIESSSHFFLVGYYVIAGPQKLCVWSEFGFPLFLIYDFPSTFYFVP